MSLLDPKSNNSLVTVSGSYGTSETAVVLTAGQGALIASMLASGAVNGVWWNPNQYPIPSDDPNREIIRLTSVPANETINILRAQEGTTAKAHATGSRILFGLTAKDINDLENKALYRDLTKKEVALDRIDNTWKQVLADAGIADVFVYDTRKDTIDPAWRFNSALSWYNEAASSTRGSKKEFPEVAVLVATATKVYIFDYETGSLWMQFNNSQTVGAGGVFFSLFMLNGKLYIGKRNNLATYAYAYMVSFTEDSFSWYGTSGDAASGGSSGKLTSHKIINRDATITITTTSPYLYIAARQVSSMNASIIASKQYAAVATDGGISIINETDNKVLNSSDTSKFISVKISPDGYLYAIKDNDHSIYRSALKVQNMDWAGLAAFTLNDILTSAIYTGSKAVSFDGVDDRLEVAHNAALNLTTDFTICLDIKMPSITGSTNIVFISKGVNMPYVGVGSGSFVFGVLGGTNVTICSAIPYQNKRINLTVTWTGGVYSAYINGTLIITASSAMTFSTTANALQIIGYLGANQLSASSLLKVRIWNYALSASRIYDLAQGKTILTDDKWGMYLYRSDFSVGLDGWTYLRATATGNNDGIGGIDDVLKVYADNVNDTHYIQKALSQTAGTFYRFTGSYMIPATNTNVDGWRLGNSNWAPAPSISNAKDGQWHAFSFLISSSDSNGSRIYLMKAGNTSFAGANSASDDIVYFKNLSLTKEGCIAEYLADNYDNSTGTWKSTENAEGGASTLNAAQATAGYKPASVAMPDKYSITAFPKGLALGSNKQMAVAMNNVLAEFIITAAGTTTTNIVTTLTTADLIQYVEKYMLIESTGEIRQITAQTNGSNAQFTTAAFSAVPSGKAKILDSSVLEGGILLLSEIDV